MRHRVVASVIAITTIIIAGLTPAPAFADESRNQEWIVDALQLDKAHELSQGNGVTVGVIDTGIDADHPDLKGNVKAGKDFAKSKGRGLNDTDGHGTAVASLIVGHGHGKEGSKGVIGIAPEAEVVSVGIDGVDRSTVGPYIEKSVKWLVDQGVDIISISGGGHPETYSVPRYAVEHDVPLVASAGNIREDSFGLGHELKDMSWPASASGAIPVSGTTRDGDFWEGGVDLGSASNQPKFGISAPAEEIIAPGKECGYSYWSGTSFSAPIVAGTLALIKSAYPHLTYEQLHERLLFTVDDKGPEGYDDKYGWGIVNPYRALVEDVEHFKGGKITKDDMVPLEEQGKTHASPEASERGGADGSVRVLIASGSNSLLLPLVVAAASVVFAGVVIAIVLLKRRTKAGSGPPVSPGTA